MACSLAASCCIQSCGECGREGADHFDLRHSVLTTDDSKVYVCNRFGHRAHIFDKSGQVINLWEGVRRPEDAASQSDGNIAVCKPSSAYCYLDELDFSAPFWV